MTAVADVQFKAGARVRRTDDPDYQGKVRLTRPDGPVLVDWDNGSTVHVHPDAIEPVPSPVKFRLEFFEDGGWKVIATMTDPEEVGGQHAWHIADIWFNGGEWLLVKYDTNHDVIHLTNAWLDVDHERWAELRDHSNSVAELNASEENQTLRDARDAALATARRQFRERTEEDAKLLGLAKAKVHWRQHFNL